MSRLVDLVERDMLPPEAQAAFDVISASRSGYIGGPFAMLLRSPELAARAAHLGTFVRFESSIPADVRSLVALVTACEYECTYMLSGHPRAAAESGVSQATIDCVMQRVAPDGLPDADAQVIRFTRSLVNQHRVDDASFKAMVARLGERGLIELTSTIGYYSMLSCTLNACEVPGRS